MMHLSHCDFNTSIYSESTDRRLFYNLFGIGGIKYTVCTNVNNYVIFVPHVPIYWSERINKVEKGGGVNLVHPRAPPFEKNPKNHY